MFDVIERLKSQWTDKYVVISRPAPELARFANATGVVRTVNMNGRCLVEFDQFNNIGWYDIDPSFLRIVPEPLPKPAAKPTAAKAPAAKSAPAAKPPAPKPAAEKAPAAPRPAAKQAGRPSTADILALARGKKAAAEAGPAAAVTPPPTVAEPSVPADEARGEAEPVAPAQAAEDPEPAAKPAVKPQKLATTAEKIAWCRAHDGKG